MARERSDTAFDAVMALLILWWILGIYLDGRSHLHDAPESFLTVEHLVFYTAFAAVAAWLAYGTLRNRRDDQGLLDAIPAGYAPAAVGLALFALGGASDAAWHILFGIEGDVEALVSPTHLLLAAGGGLFASGPLAAAWHRRRQGLALLPALLSAAAVLSVVTFMTAYAHPIVASWRADPHGLAPVNADRLLLASVTLQSAILAAFAVPLARRFDVPPGGLGLALGLNAALLSLFAGRPELIPVWAAAGLAGDAANHRLDRRRRLRVLAATVPLVATAGYVTARQLTGAPIGSIHLAAGVAVVGGVVGAVVGVVVTVGDRG